MKKIFLAYSFRDEDGDLASYVEHLLASHDLLTVTGENVGGGGITPAVRRRIEQCDGLVALLTRRDQLANGGWTTHDWVQFELNHARDAGIPCVGVFEEGVSLAGPYADHERIDLRRENLIQTVLKLSHTIGEWKREAGRTVKVQLLPEDVALRVGGANGGVKCRYRFVRGGAFDDWREAVPIPETGGTFVFVPGIQDDYMIQIEVNHGDTNWASRATSQFLPVNLHERSGA